MAVYRIVLFSSWHIVYACNLFLCGSYPSSSSISFCSFLSSSSVSCVLCVCVCAPPFFLTRRYNVPQNKVQAEGARDSLAKAIYDRLFDWIVLQVRRTAMTTAIIMMLMPLVTVV